MFRLVWLQTALDQLMAIWMQADSALRQAITAATHQIDQKLQSDPHASGESRPEGTRIFFIAPLGIIFRVEQDDKTVSVLRVWLFQKRQKES